MSMEQTLKIESELRRRLDVLESTRAFYAASTSVEADEFHIFTATQIDQQRGVELMAWVPLAPAGDAGSYPIRYLEPATALGMRLGADLGAYPEYVHAFRIARASRRVVFADAPTSGAGDGRRRLLAAIAIRDGGTHRLDEKKGQGISGFVVGVLDLGVVIQHALAFSAAGLGLDLTMYEREPATKARVIFRARTTAPEENAAATSPKRSRHDLQTIHHFTLAGRHFAVVATTMPGLFAARRMLSGVPFLVLGFVSSIAATAYYWQRQHAAAARQRAMRISAALARVGRELLGVAETTEVLHRLGELTTHALGCDDSYTWLHDEHEHSYRPIAGHSLSPELGVRSIHVPQELLDPIVQTLRSKSVVQMTQRSATTPIATLMTTFGTTALLCVALHRDGEIIGLQTAGFRRPGTTFTPAQEQIAVGIAQLASLALANARLVEDLESVNRVKSEFVSTMSHELRTPLNVIFGYTELLRDPTFAETERVKLLDQIDQRGRDLLEIIEHTLQVGALEAGAHALRLEPVALAELWSDLAVAAGERRRHDGPTLDWAPIPDIRVVTDAHKLKIILLNLVANALKFTDNGSVHVAAEIGPTKMIFRVVDTGIGIRPEDHAVIFELFRQADGSDTRRYGGTGIGLYIVRRFVDQLRGTIVVDSTPGQGSTFTVTLPCVRGTANVSHAA